MKTKIATTKEEINTCYKLRTIVFVEEQKVPMEEELDSYDDIAVHFLLFSDSNLPIGVGRMYAENGKAVIGRLCILKKYRGIGAGNFLMQDIIKYCREQGFHKAVLGAQEYAIDFYKKLGFEIISGRYMDANIPHFKMQLDLSINYLK